MYDDNKPVAVLETLSVINLMAKAQLTRTGEEQPVDMLTLPAISHKTSAINSKISALDALKTIDKLKIRSLEVQDDSSSAVLGVVIYDSLICDSLQKPL